MKNKGYFIVIDGCDAAGKDTSIETVKDYFKENTKEKDVIVTREPGGTYYGEQIRKMLLDVTEDKEEMSIDTELLLFFASRKQLINEVIKPNLKEDNIVIANRWTSSTYTYQKLRGAEPYKILALDNMFCDVEPDLFIYLDVDPEVTIERINKNRGGKLERTETFDLEAIKEIREGYKEYMKTVKNCITIDANQPKEKVLSDVEGELHKYFDSKKKSNKKYYSHDSGPGF